MKSDNLYLFTYRSSKKSEKEFTIYICAYNEIQAKKKFEQLIPETDDYMFTRLGMVYL
jgi:hypothetical protein